MVELWNIGKYQLTHHPKPIIPIAERSGARFFLWFSWFSGRFGYTSCRKSDLQYRDFDSPFHISFFDTTIYGLRHVSSEVFFAALLTNPCRDPLHKIKVPFPLLPPIKNGPTHHRKSDPPRQIQFLLPRGNHLFSKCSNQLILGAFGK